MRLNKFLAQNTSLSRRSADEAIASKRVKLNDRLAQIGDQVGQSDKVKLDNKEISAPTSETKTTIIINKPVGYVCSRNGQGNKTIYDLLPQKYHGLNPVGRLDKNSSGVLVLTNDGDLANELTHPRYQKKKIYEVELNKSLEPLHQQMINDFGIQLEDGPSKLALEKLAEDRKKWRITMSEGRNRQIRRTFQALNYKVFKLHRTNFGNYDLSGVTNLN